MFIFPPAVTTEERTGAWSGRFHFIRYVLLTGLIAGTLDAIAAILDFVLPYRGDPSIAFQYIASGVFGKGAIGGGVGMTLSGILFHYAFAISWAALFFVLRPRVRILGGPWYLSGSIYAVVVWIGMNLVIRPLSAVPHIPWTIFKVIKSALILVVTIGSPIAFAASKYFGSTSVHPNHFHRH